MFRKAILAACLVGALATAGCTNHDDNDSVSVGNATPAFPSEQITDWVSYADHVVYFTVLAERELPLGEHEQTVGEGMVDREVTVRIDQIVWSSSGALAPPLPDQLAIGTWGWTLHRNQKEPFVAPGAPRLEVGNSYLAAWRFDPDDGWGPHTFSSLLPVDESSVALRDPLHDPADEAVSALAGKTPDEVRATLHATAPDPVALRYFHLRPEQRCKLFVLDAQMPDVSGFHKAAQAEGNIYHHGAVGYVRVADWDALVAGEAPGDEIRLFDEHGQPADAAITVTDLVLLGPGQIVTAR